MTDILLSSTHKISLLQWRSRRHLALITPAFQPLHPHRQDGLLSTLNALPNALLPSQIRIEMEEEMMGLIMAMI